MEKRIVIAYLRRSRPRKRENMIKYRVLASNFRDLALCFRVFASCFRVFFCYGLAVLRTRPRKRKIRCENAKQRCELVKVRCEIAISKRHFFAISWYRDLDTDSYLRDLASWFCIWQNEKAIHRLSHTETIYFTHSYLVQEKA
jgi:hypothetical protein